MDVEGGTRAGTIAFVCAMPIELQPVVKKLSLQRVKRQGVTVHSGELDGQDVVAVVTGMGTALARAGVTELLDAVTEVDRVVVVGITGAVERDVRIGTLLCPETILNSNTGQSFTPTSYGPGEPHGVLYTTDIINSGEEVLAGLRAQGVVGLDMETAAVGEVCAERGIDWTVFRVVSDGPADEVDEEVFKLSNQDGTPNPKNIARYLLKHPNRIPAMARMGKNVKTATNAAADAAIAWCRTAGTTT